MLDTIWQVCIIGISTHKTLSRRRIKMTKYEKYLKVTKWLTARNLKKEFKNYQAEINLSNFAKIELLAWNKYIFINLTNRD